MKQKLRSSGHKPNTRILASIVGLLVIWSSVTSHAANRVIHRERSLYQTILVTKETGRLCLQFSVRREQRNQSCLNPRKPKEMLFPYARMMMASLLLNPNPKRILIVGLGGGTLPTALTELYPQAALTVVEIDPAVVAVAKEYFNYTPTANTELVVQDARVFTKRKALQLSKADTATSGYDLVMLDAFNGDYIPEHLLTREYLQETRSIMAPDGVLAANTFAISQLYDHESTTYTDVFGKFLNYRLPQTGNRVILALNDESAPLPDRELLEQRAAVLEPTLVPYRVQLKSKLKRILGRPDWDPDARILTDQYAPGNILGARKRAPGSR
ncbi:MAG: fused MFS/spermidine synthase [Pseudomonadales bacterium]